MTNNGSCFKGRIDFSRAVDPKEFALLKTILRARSFGILRIKNIFNNYPAKSRGISSDT